MERCSIRRGARTQVTASRGKVLEALEEIDEQGARAAARGVDDVVLLVELLLAGEPQGDRHGDYNEDLINNKPKESDQNHSAARDERRMKQQH